MSIHKALFAVQGRLRGVKKDSKNPHFKNSYASLEEVTDTLRPVTQEFGLYWRQSPGKIVDGSIEVTTTIIHAETETEFSFVMEMPMSKRDPQGAGSALTYAMRYSLMAAFGLPPTDDDAEVAIDRKDERPKPEATDKDIALKGQIASLEAELDAIGTLAGLKGFWTDNYKGISAFDDKTKKRFTDKKDALKKKLESADHFPGDD